ncbi:MAG TPA: Flp pilus assembly protein CpaB [Candidatus Dormibacteraeota bacterium]|nr:Flp pilus assembly protein CpaB [Candidatus Dormibacteraeota bacterium]
MKRSVYLSVCVVLSAVAGIFYYAQTRQSTAVVATRDLSVGVRIQDTDLAVRSVNPLSLGGQVLRTPDQAIGQVVAHPILEGQFIDARQIAPSKNAALLTAGLEVPPGYRIIGVPIAPATAVGGVLKPGDFVDVMAIPNPSKSAAIIDEPAPAPITIGKNVLVLGLRTDQGAQVDQSDHGLSVGNSKPESVLLAIPASDETTYSLAIASSTFVLAMSTD